MTITSYTLTVDLNDEAGAALDDDSGYAVTALLVDTDGDATDDYTSEGGFFPTELEAEPDANGQAQLSLVPNTAGSQDSRYQISVIQKRTGRLLSTRRIQMPASDSDLGDLVASAAITTDGIAGFSTVTLASDDKVVISDTSNDGVGKLAALNEVQTDLSSLGASLLPDTDSAYDIGSNALAWATGYFDRVGITGGRGSGAASAAPDIYFIDEPTWGIWQGDAVRWGFSHDGASILQFRSDQILVPSSVTFGWQNSDAVSAGFDLELHRDGADTLAQRRSTNPQTFNVYGTYTDVSNYERLELLHTGSSAIIRSTSAGTGNTAVLDLGFDQTQLRFQSGQMRAFVDLNAIVDTIDIGSSGRFGTGYFTDLDVANDVIMSGTLLQLVADSTVAGWIQAGSQATGAALYLGGNNQNLGLVAASIFNGGIRLRQPNTLSWSSGAAINTSSDLELHRDAADALALRRDTNAQTFNIYGTYTDASNYERGKIGWASNIFEVGTEVAGAGGNRSLRLLSALGYVEMDSTGARIWMVGNGAIGLTNSAQLPGDLIFGNSQAVTTRAKLAGTTDPRVESKLADDSDFAQFATAGLVLSKRSADPDDPAEGEAVQWMSDGTGSGDDGDIMMKITAGAVTKTVTLVDFSAA